MLDESARESENFIVTPLFGSLVHWYIISDGWGQIISLAELLGDEDQIEDIDDAIAVGIWSGLTESVGNLYQIQDVDLSITVDIGETFGCEIDFAIEIGELVGGGRSVISPIGNGGGKRWQCDWLGLSGPVVDRPAVCELSYI